jgi:hypothetical protein
MTTASSGYKVFFGLESATQVRLTPMTEKKLPVTSMPAFQLAECVGPRAEAEGRYGERHKPVKAPGPIAKIDIIADLVFE